MSLTLSGGVVLAAVGVLASRGVTRGIEFTGGVELQLKFARTPDLGSIRSALSRVTTVTPLVTTIGNPDEGEVYIKLGSAAASQPARGEDATRRVVEALQDGEQRRRRAAGGVDLNVADEATVLRLLENSAGVGAGDATAAARAVLVGRRDLAIFHSMDEVGRLPGVSAAALGALERGAFLGPFALRSQSYIGPVIGKELLQKALLAIAGSLLGMLVYIWIRYEFNWGLAAVLALAHDTVITLGLFALTGKELSLPVVAAFLTLIGYSVNDTVVVFDRIRENIRARGERDLPELINRSINQTLSRTTLTSGLTWMTVTALFLFGGEALSAFSFVLSVGIIVGTYSSIFVASPLVVIWKAFVQRRGRSAGRPGEARPSPVRKLPANPAG
jgi:preprotein translocase subunit SecF